MGVTATLRRLNAANWFFPLSVWLLHGTPRTTPSRGVSVPDRLRTMTLPPEDLPPVAAAAYQQLNDQQKLAFNAYYNSRKRSMALMVALSILFPVQLFFLGRVLLGILFLITGGGLGIWYLIEWFLTPGRVREYNARVANEALAAVGQSGVEELPAADEEE